jgi:hypothetical protein
MSEQTDCAPRKRKPPTLENKGSLITYKDADCVWFQRIS